ncbi:hypothetical protein DHW03_17145 [Pedobacter yonginense]|uniref:Bacteriocin n=1 Tax=Pedobacter yonginense TaxID=651869 RepID=A0A317EIW3_9SPHI|nr:hypothetical protein [Pedobacter yonginense]PWS26504.1 hypothetical protein DHW03_17145 [Pedobacter yonginense]
MKKAKFTNENVLSREQLKNVNGGKVPTEDACLAYVTNHSCPNTYATLNEAIAGCDQGCTGITLTYIC